MPTLTKQIIEAAIDGFEAQKKGSWPKSAIEVEGLSIQKVGDIAAGVNPGSI